MKLALVLLGLLACGGAPEHVNVEPVPLPSSQAETHGVLAPPALAIVGTYGFDVDATRPYYEEALAKLPADEQETRKLALAMLDKFSAELVVEAAGGVKMTTELRIKGNGDDKPRTQIGTWRREGAEYVLTSDDRRDMRCTYDGTHLACTDDRSETVVFTRKR